MNATASDLQQKTMTALAAFDRATMAFIVSQTPDTMRGMYAARKRYENAVAELRAEISAH